MKPLTKVRCPDCGSARTDLVGNQWDATGYYLIYECLHCTALFSVDPEKGQPAADPQEGR